MRRLIILIYLFSLAVLFCGCQETQKQKTPAVPLEGIKIRDIMPQHKEELPPAINFKVFTFEMPATSYPAFSEAFNGLQNNVILFSNYNNFQKNGFQAGFGREEMWKLVGDNLQRVKARKTATRTIISYDESPNDLFINNIVNDTMVSYISIAGKSTDVQLLPGVATLRFKARILAERRGAAQLKIEAIAKHPVNAMIARMPGNEKIGETVFKPTSMIMKINEGEFVLLGPDPDHIPATDQKIDPVNFIEKHSLVDLFFMKRGDFAVPKTNPDQNDIISRDSFFDIKEDIPLVQVFIITCAGVQN